MKFKIEKSALFEVLQAAIKAVPNKSTFQILNNFCLRLEGNFLEVSATDLDLGIRVKVEVAGERDGAVVINAHKFLEQIRGLTDPKITTVSLDFENSKVKISWSERGFATIPGFDNEEFPPFPEITDGETLNLAASELAFLVEKTIFATSTDAVRMNLNGVNLTTSDGKISMVATDGHRLGRAFIEQEGVVASTNVIIPKKPLQQILSMAKGDATIEIRTSSTHIVFSTGSTQVVSKLIDGSYPNIHAVIPPSFERTIQFNTEEFQYKMSSVMAQANVRTHKVRLVVEDNMLELNANDSDSGGDSRENLAVTHNGEGSFSIGFDGRFLTEIMKLCKSEEAVLNLNNPKSACIINPVGEGLNFSFLLMPTHLQED